MKSVYNDLNKQKWPWSKNKTWQQKHLYQGKYKLQIDFRPEEPENIKWENMDIKPKEKFGRRAVQKLLLILLMCFTVMIFILNN